MSVAGVQTVSTGAGRNGVVVLVHVTRNGVYFVFQVV